MAERYLQPSLYPLYSLAGVPSFKGKSIPVLPAILSFRGDHVGVALRW
jgi:hypothetical protein